MKMMVMENRSRAFIETFCCHYSRVTRKHVHMSRVIVESLAFNIIGRLFGHLNDVDSIQVQDIRRSYTVK